MTAAMTVVNPASNGGTERTEVSRGHSTRSVGKLRTWGRVEHEECIETPIMHTLYRRIWVHRTRLPFKRSTGGSPEDFEGAPSV
jgi:hypothetical protein